VPPFYFLEYFKIQLMAGHSKWSTIKRQKAANDLKRGKIFSKLTKEVSTLAKTNPDPNFNPSLKVAIDKAKKAGVPKSNIENAISGKGVDNTQDIILEGYGIGGVKLIIEASTDNNNRTVNGVRGILNKSGGSLGTANSVMFDFSRVGEIIFNKGGKTNQEIEEFLIELPIQEYDMNTDQVFVETGFEYFREAERLILESGMEIESSQITYKPLTLQEFDQEIIDKNLNLIDKLEELDDVDSVYSSLWL
jgi:YebC/PmpR family DNA-binding regulatory protein